MEYFDELKELIDRYKDKGIEYGKEVSYLEKRNSCSIEEINSEILSLSNVTKIEKQKKDGEERYVVFFVYSRTKGRTYAITFRDKIRIITAYPIGKKTLKKYFKKRFKKSN